MSADDYNQRIEATIAAAKRKLAEDDTQPIDLAELNSTALWALLVNREET